MSVCIMEGDQYGIGIRITSKCTGELITNEDVEDVEICIGKYTKTYASGELTYSDERFIFPLTQEESFNFDSKSLAVQVRVKLIGGDIVGEGFDRIPVKESRSKERL